MKWKWQWIVVLLCCYGSLKEFRPSEPYLYQYQHEDLGISEDTLNSDVSRLFFGLLDIVDPRNKRYTETFYLRCHLRLALWLNLRLILSFTLRLDSRSYLKRDSILIQDLSKVLGLPLLDIQLSNRLDSSSTPHRYLPLQTDPNPRKSVLHRLLANPNLWPKCLHPNPRPDLLRLRNSHWSCILFIYLCQSWAERLCQVIGGSLFKNLE